MSQPAPPGDLVARLDDLGVLEVRGPDAAAFLQGQLTSDVSAVSASRGQHSAYCNVKGRVLALFRLLLVDDRYLLLMPRETIAPLRERLLLYRMHAKVELDEAGPPQLVLGLAGVGAAERVARLVDPLPAEPGEIAHGPGLTLLAVEPPSPRFLLLARPDAAELAERELAGLPWGGRGAWTLLDVRAGLPTIVSDTAGAFLPQMLRLGEIGAVSFTKGCFPGQEVVARTEHLGAVKRLLVRARVAGDAPGPGTRLRALRDGREGDGGRVVAAAPDGPAAELLAVVPTDAAARADLRLGSADGPAVEILDGPWSAGTPAPGRE